MYLGALMLLLGLVPGTIEESYQLKMIQATPPAELSELVQAVLPKRAYQICNSQGEIVCEVWFREKLPLKATAEQVKNGLTYREVEQTTLLGAIRFPRATKNYRQHEVPAGVYTLRFAIQPPEGDHLGTAPYQEFCLLSAAKDDQKPETIDVKELYEHSAASLGGKHPSMMLLFPHPATGAKPKLTDEGKGHWVLRTVLEIQSEGQYGKLGLGLTVVGHSPLS